MSVFRRSSRLPPVSDSDDVPSTLAAPSIAVVTDSSDNLSTLSVDNRSTSRLSPVTPKPNSRLSPLRIVSRSRTQRANSVSTPAPAVPPTPTDTDAKKQQQQQQPDTGPAAPTPTPGPQATPAAQTMASVEDDAHVAPSPPPDGTAALGQAAQAHAQQAQHTRERAGRHAHRDSIVQRVAERLQSPHGEGKSRRRRRRRASTTSTAASNMSRTPPVLPASASTNGIAAALAKSGLQITGDEQVLKASLQNRAVSSAGRSPYLVRQDYESDDGYGSEDESDIMSDEEGLDNLPVTGFAVASNRRNAEFHSLFPSVDEGDYLIEDYGCALAKDILVHGRLYVSENHICFHSNLFGWVTDVVIPFADVQEIEKKMTALVIPNAIGVYTSKERYTFASLISRDSTFDVLMNIWRIAHPDMEMTSSTAPNGGDEPASPDEATPAEAGVVKAAHKSTECACAKAGEHYAEVALDTTFPSTPEKVYNLMFNSGWYRTFMSDSQKLRDIESSEWHPGDDKKLMRTTSYIKPLYGSIGPKQTKCQIVDVHEHCDFDNYITMITTTRTPDVPSGGVFSVKTRTCFTWASASSTRVLVTTEVEWTGKSWVKGIIEKSAVDGQKQYHDDLAREMRAYMKEHASEFAVAGVEPEPSGSEPAASEAGEAGPTKAQAYAEAATRRGSRKSESEAWLLQGCLDSITSGASMIASGLGTGAKLVTDMLDESRFSKTSLMVGVIGLLALSNVYTYWTRPESQHRVKRLQRFGPTDEAVTEAVRQILARRAATTPREEVAQLVQMLNEVEARAANLRQLLLATGAADDDREGVLRINEMD